MIIKDVDLNPFDIIRYLPVSAMSILSMTIGYFGLRYIEISIAARVQNSDCAVLALLLFVYFTREQFITVIINIIGIIVVTVVVITLAVFEKQTETYVLKKSNQVNDPKYQLSVLAISFPILYALIDGIGTFADGIYLDELKLISEDSALIAY